MATALDTAGGFPSPQAIKDAGHAAMVCYVSPSRPGTNFKSKPLTREAADTLRNGGVDLASNWQYGKPGDATPSDWTRGYDGGVADAKKALAAHFAAGGPGWCPIFFSIDEDISLANWNKTAVKYFQGVNSVIGKEWTGIYGHSRVVDWAIEDDVIGKSTTEGKYWIWQTRAWSNGEIHPKAVLYQRVIDTPSAPGPVVGGIRVDVNDILAADWGQWQHDRTPKSQPQPPITPGAPAVNAPVFTEKDMYGNGGSNRWGAKVDLALWHTEEGDASAESLARYCDGRNGVSYHDILRDGILCHVVDDDLASWSVLDANPRSYNLCFAGTRASWSRQQWLNRADDIRIAVWVSLEVCRRKGIEARIIEPPYFAGSGISDHNYVTRVLRIGTHTDLGVNFPWDLARRFLDEFLNGAAVQPPVIVVENKIDKEAVRAAAWIGNRVTQGEIPVGEDGLGRFAEFENGWVYFHPGGGEAHAIPRAVFETWAALGFENSELGYPTGDHTVLEEGVVQGFERGAIYRKNGSDGYFVTGMIRARWNRLGFEKSFLGWPISNEIRHPDGTVEQHFEGGLASYSPDGITTIQQQGSLDLVIPDRH